MSEITPNYTVNRQARGDERRLHILRATWQVIIDDGIRGVRHRAVAEAAGVPLASTSPTAHREAETAKAHRG